ncbi:MAG: hypothetical protein GY723_08870 [bacterium]|nr:hypothetical protein [bacterium]
MSMAILDATKGAPRTLIQRVQKICYAYDPEGRNYVIKVNQIVLYVTLFGVGVFVVVFLIIRRRPRKPGDRTLAPAPAGSDLPEERPV